MKRPIIICTLLGAMFAFAETEAKKDTDGSKKAVGEGVQALINRETGGTLRVKHKNTKSIAYVNAQKRANLSLITEARDAMSTMLDTEIELHEGTFTFPSPKIIGELTLYVIDDENMPMSLISTEARWAFVNVAPLAKGAGEKKPFFEARVKKEMLRVGCLLLGGTSSTYPGNILGPVMSAEDLDKFDKAVLPIDGINRVKRYLLSLKVKPWRTTTYRRACMEGWAPQPTNDIQKAIWKEVYTMPDKPLTIKHEKK